MSAQQAAPDQENSIVERPVVDVYWARSGQDYSNAVELLSIKERDRYRRFLCSVSADSFLAGRLLLRSVVAERHGCSPKKVRLESSSGGKLFAPDTSLEFSLSRTGPWVALAITSRYPVGLDVEGLGMHAGQSSVEPLVLSPSEQQSVSAYSGEARTRAFTRIWTRKEAVLKATGQGLCSGLAELEVGGADSAPHVQPRQNWMTAVPPLTLVDLQDRPNALAALAVLTLAPLRVIEHRDVVELPGRR